MQRTLYFGPPQGVYAPAPFGGFVHGIVSAKLREIGSPSKCNEEGEKENMTYHFPDAGIGLQYRLINENRCAVDLLGTRESVMDDITEFIFEQDNK